MTQALNAVLERDGSIRLLDTVGLVGPRRVVVIVLNEPPRSDNETLLLSQAALADDWLRPEEDAAWLHFQSAR